MEDREILINLMKGLQEGDFSDADAESFADKELAQAYNAMVKGVTDRNNQMLARINDAMNRIGYNGNIKALLEQIESQQTALKRLQKARDDLNFSMQTVEDSGFEMLALSRQIRNSYEPYTQDLTTNYEEVQDALNATRNIINDIKHLDSSTYTDEERVAYLEEFVAVMETFVNSVELQRQNIQEAVENLKALNGRIETVIEDILIINETVDRQNNTSSLFLSGVDSVVQSYDELSIDAFAMGNQLYRISRDIDNARNDMFRHNSRPTIHDTLRVYEMDHFVLSWRVYNHIVELETLKLTQVNNPDKCKFGIWCNTVKDEFIISSEAFRKTFDAHIDLHKHAVAAYMAKEDMDMALARKEFSKTLDGFGRFQLGLEELHTLYIKNGILDETPLWKFK